MRQIEDNDIVVVSKIDSGQATKQGRSPVGSRTVGSGRGNRGSAFSGHVVTVVDDVGVVAADDLEGAGLVEDGLGLSRRNDSNKSSSTSPLANSCSPALASSLTSS